MPPIPNGLIAVMVVGLLVGIGCLILNELRTPPGSRRK
jgi:hypothetical protein